MDNNEEKKEKRQNGFTWWYLLITGELQDFLKPRPKPEARPLTRSFAIWKAILCVIFFFFIQIGTMFILLGIGIENNVELMALTFSTLASLAAFSFMYFKKKDEFKVEYSSKETVYLFTIIMAMAASVLATFILYWLPRIFSIPPQGSNVVNMITLENLWLLILGMFLIGVAVPIVEELIFRGLVQNFLNQKLKFRTANFFQALIFGIIHVQPAGIVAAFLMGLVLGWLYKKTGRLVVPIVGHCIFNVTSLLTMFIPNIIWLFTTVVGIIILLTALILAIVATVTGVKKYTYKIEVEIEETLQ
jgi:hypothetical protein